MEHIIQIATHVINSFAAIWPYLLITIPLAVAVQVSGMSKHIRNIFSKQPLISILLATVVGAFSPFCSCGVVPLIASLLIGGVPLAPVMSFWIASPSMDPELVPLSIATIGWNLSLWRLGASLAISLLAGFVTHFALERGYLGENLLRHKGQLGISQTLKTVSCCESTNTQRIPVAEPAEASRGRINMHPLQLSALAKTTDGQTVSCCTSASANLLSTSAPAATMTNNSSSCCSSGEEDTKLWTRIWQETRNATWLIVKFMSLAFLVTALIKTWLPQDALHGFLHMDGYVSVFVATLVGIPTYTSNMLALPLIGEFLALGMNPGAALAFLLAGPVTTLPAMIAVWGIASRRVFLLYLGFSVVGAIVAGVLLNVVG